MSTDYVADTLGVIRSFEGSALLPHAIRLLANGEPVPLEKLAAASGQPLADIKTALSQQSSAEWDEAGRLVGLVLTLRPTSHRFSVDGHQLYGWCADDTLMFPVILGVPAHVESKCPQTGRAIRVELTPEAVKRVDPPEAVVSAVRPAGKLADVRSAACRHGHFFSSKSAAMDWAEKHPTGTLHSVPEAFRLDREVMHQLGWNASRSDARSSPVQSAKSEARGE